MNLPEDIDSDRPRPAPASESGSDNVAGIGNVPPEGPQDPEETIIAAHSETLPNAAPAAGADGIIEQSTIAPRSTPESEIAANDSQRDAIRRTEQSESVPDDATRVALDDVAGDSPTIPEPGCGARR
jgi:hypothetical protein